MSSPMASRLRDHIGSGARAYAVVIVFATLFILLAVTNENFLTIQNLSNILNANAAVGIIACGVTVAIIAGVFDLSVGATFALGGVCGALVANATNAPLGIIAGIAVGALVGVLNGVSVARLKVNSFIATLSTGYILRGIAVLLTGGTLVSVSVQGFDFLGAGEILGIKVPILIFFLVAITLGFLLSFTVFGRHVFAAGSNPDAARLSGVNVDSIRMLAFVISGAAAGLAGVMAASRFATAKSGDGVGFELIAIAAVVVGGTSLFGGEGAIWRTVVGVLLLALVGNGFNLLNVDPFYQSIVQGVIILAAAAADAWFRGGWKPRRRANDRMEQAQVSPEATAESIEQPVADEESADSPSARVP